MGDFRFQIWGCLALGAREHDEIGYGPARQGFERRDGRMNMAWNDTGPMHLCQCQLLSSTNLLHINDPASASYPNYPILSAEEKSTKEKVKGLILSDQGQLKLASVQSRAEASAIQHRSGLLHSMAMHAGCRKPQGPVIRPTG
jgi:hypothetical protein